MAKSKKTYKFKAGDRFTLDSIYAVQGLAGGDWWDRTGDDLTDDRKKDIDMSEDLICTRDVTITIVVETPNAADEPSR